MTPAKKSKLRKEINFYKKNFMDIAHCYAEKVELGVTPDDWTRREFVKRHHKAQVAQVFESLID